MRVEPVSTSPQPVRLETAQMVLLAEDIPYALFYLRLTPPLPGIVNSRPIGLGILWEARHGLLVAMDYQVSGIAFLRAITEDPNGTGAYAQVARLVRALGLYWEDTLWQGQWPYPFLPIERRTVKKPRIGRKGSNVSLPMPDPQELAPWQARLLGLVSGPPAPTEADLSALPTWSLDDGPAPLNSPALALDLSRYLGRLREEPEVLQRALLRPRGMAHPYLPHRAPRPKRSLERPRAEDEQEERLALEEAWWRVEEAMERTLEEDGDEEPPDLLGPDLQERLEDAQAIARRDLLRARRKWEALNRRLSAGLDRPKRRRRRR